MTVDKVRPCICSMDDYVEKQIDDSNYGMPVLTVCNGLVPHKQFWSIWCPKCGRGSKLVQYDSSFKAIRDWNKMQVDNILKDAGWIE